MYSKRIGCKPYFLCFDVCVFVYHETLHSNGKLPSLRPARYYCRTDQSCLGEAAPEGLTTVVHEMHGVAKDADKKSTPKTIRHGDFISCHT